MKLRVLGSSAGKTVPRPFCRCRVCEHAKLHRGRNMRTRTGVQIFIDRDSGSEARYHVDMSPDTGHHMMRDGFNLERLEHLLITHPDEDHFAPMYIRHRLSILSDKTETPELHLYGNPDTGIKLKASAPDPESIGIRFHEIAPFQSFQAGDMEVFSLAAEHTPGALNFIIRAEGKCALLAWDTGCWPEKTWEALMADKPVFDVVLMECTHLGPERKLWNSHQDFVKMLEMRDGLIELGCIESTTPFALNHIGDNGGLTHDEAVDFAGEHGVIVSYDGFDLEF